MGLVLLRYGEIALKGQNRIYFYRKLRHNVRQCLKANGIEAQVWQEGQRLYLETADVEAAVGAVRRVFGVVSLSPVQVVDEELGAIAEAALEMAGRAGLGPGKTFRVRASRSDKSFPLTSPQLEAEAGGTVWEATHAQVKLKGEVDLEIGVEVQRGRALLFGESLAGPGGLPLGSQGQVVALLSGGIDSPVAAWLMMTRGCGVVPVHFTTSPAQTEQVRALVEALGRYAYGHRLHPLIFSQQELLGPVLELLEKHHAERWTCLFCKRAMLAKASEIAEEYRASALVTGDSLGQVASQTLSNLEVISYAIPKPILRPLIGLDKTEIMDLARRIGTYDVSTSEQHACPYLPSRPLTRAHLRKLKALLEEMEVTGKVYGLPGPAIEQEVDSDA